MGVIYFGSPKEANGYLNNDFPCEFVWHTERINPDLFGQPYIEITTTGYDLKFTSMTQYMMFRKALLFGDIETMNKIMHTADINKIKSLGRSVTNFVETIWERECFVILCVGLICKFSQNVGLGQRLIKTGDAVFAYCNSWESYYGIGYGITDSRKENVTAWKGRNNLGVALGKTRDVLRNR